MNSIKYQIWDHPFRDHTISVWEPWKDTKTSNLTVWHYMRDRFWRIPFSSWDQTFNQILTEM